jgi:tetratricopeptide (TPR) repeat protein
MPMRNNPSNEPAPLKPPKPELDETQPTRPDLDVTQVHRPEISPDEATQAVRTAQSADEGAARPETPVTQPDSVNPPPPPPTAERRVSVEAPRKRSWRWVLLALLGLLLLAGIGLASGYGGYLSAIQMRLSNQATQVAADAQAQFDLGMQDLMAERYDLARQRFEYVIQLDPNFPGVTEALAQVLLAVNTTATPTIAPTPTLSPTPDLRGQEELYLQAREYLTGGDWTNAIDTLLTLRKRFPDYLTVEVDGLLYVALRNRGVQKISILSDLESGTYDLSLASGFGPLDVEARNWRDWAVLYIRGASFWDVDWPQAVFYFSQLAQIAPNLMDASFLTAVERYRLALIGYGDWLARQELWCEAQEQYQLSLNFQNNPELEPTVVFVSEECANPSQSEGEGGVVTLTPTLPGVVTLTPTPPGAEVTPTSEPTATEAPQPTDTEVPTDTPEPDPEE